MKTAGVSMKRTAFKVNQDLFRLMQPHRHFRWKVLQYQLMLWGLYSMIPAIWILFWQQTCFTPSCWLIAWEYERLLSWSYLHVVTRSREPGELETPLWKFWSKTVIESISSKDNVLLHTWSHVLLRSLAGEKRTKVGGHAGTKVSSHIWLRKGGLSSVCRNFCVCMCMCVCMYVSMLHTHIQKFIYTKGKSAKNFLNTCCPGKGLLSAGFWTSCADLSSSVGSLSCSPFASRGQNKQLSC